MKQSNVGQAALYIWLIIIWCLLRPVIVAHTPDVVFTYVKATGKPYKWPDLVFFLMGDIAMLIVALAFQRLTNLIVAWVFLALAVGKIMDEFVSPFGYWWGEVVWDVAVFACAYVAYRYRNRKTY